MKSEVMTVAPQLNRKRSNRGFCTQLPLPGCCDRAPEVSFRAHLNLTTLITQLA